MKSFQTILFPILIAGICSSCSIDAPPICTEGATKCENNQDNEGQLFTCVDSAWKSTTTCQDSFGQNTSCESDKKCPENCTVGDTLCKDEYDSESQTQIGYLYQCNTEQLYEKLYENAKCRDSFDNPVKCKDDKQCPENCTDGDIYCKDEYDSESQTEIGNLYQCREQRYIKTKCTDGFGNTTCQDSTQCPPKCTEGHITCRNENGVGVQYECDSNGKYTNRTECKDSFNQNIDCDSITNQCPEKCTEGDTFCKDEYDPASQTQIGNLYQCRDQFYIKTKCTDGFGNNTECQTPDKCPDKCIEGQIICRNKDGYGVQYTCDSNGQYTNRIECKDSFHHDIECDSETNQCPARCQEGTTTCKDLDGHGKQFTCDSEGYYSYDNSTDCEDLFGKKTICASETRCPEPCVNNEHYCCKEGDDNCPEDRVNYLYTCKDGVFKNPEQCPGVDVDDKVCDDSKSCKKCNDNETKCIENTNGQGTQYKCQNQAWVVNTSCYGTTFNEILGCNGNVCKDECSNNETRCYNNTLYTCNNNQFVEEKKCEYGCQNSKSCRNCTQDLCSFDKNKGFAILQVCNNGDYSEKFFCPSCTGKKACSGCVKELNYCNKDTNINPQLNLFSDCIKGSYYKNYIQYKDKTEGYCSDLHQFYIFKESTEQPANNCPIDDNPYIDKYNYHYYNNNEFRCVYAPKQPFLQICTGKEWSIEIVCSNTYHACVNSSGECQHCYTYNCVDSPEINGAPKIGAYLIVQCLDEYGNLMFLGEQYQEGYLLRCGNSCDDSSCQYK